MTPQACQEARERLGWSREELARRAGAALDGNRRSGVARHAALIEMFEGGSGWHPVAPRFRVRNLRRALEAEGVQFTTGGELVKDEKAAE